MTDGEIKLLSEQIGRLDNKTEKLFEEIKELRDEHSETRVILKGIEGQIHPVPCPEIQAVKAKVHDSVRRSEISSLVKQEIEGATGRGALRIIGKVISYLAVGAAGVVAAKWGTGG